MQALIVGCSHAAGAELDREPGLEPMSFNQVTEFCWQNNFANKLAVKLGYDPINRAYGGGSNDRMFRTYWEYRQNLSSNDIIIAVWTGNDRSEFYSNTHQRWLAINLDGVTRYQVGSCEYYGERHLGGAKIPHEPEFDLINQTRVYMQTDQLGYMNKLRNVLSLNADARHRGIRVLNIEAFMSLGERMSVPDWIYYPIGTESFCNWARANQRPHTDWGHFFRDTHEDFAELIFQQHQKNLDKNSSYCYN